MPIETISPELKNIVTPDQDIEELGSGYQVAEGPLWWKEDGYLLFNEVRGDRRRQWSPNGGITLLKEPSNNANGLTRDRQGRLLLCEGGANRVTRLEPDGSTTVVASNYRGIPLNRPNDVVVKSDGSIYFTDPWTSPLPAQQWDLNFSGVYRLTPDLGTMTLLVDDFLVPNGLAFSPDESILYINDSRRGHIRAFDMQPNGTLARASDRVFSDLRGDKPGVPDGMKVDVEGTVYCGGSGGIWIIDPLGNHLGTIEHGQSATTNLAWGGDDWKTLFFTSRNTLGRVQSNVAGLPVPASR